MISVRDYIKLLIKKKKWTHKRLCNELNKIEDRIGEPRTVPQNITNYLNGYHEFGWKVLIKYELALGLEFGTLLNMISLPATINSKKELKEFIKKVRSQ